MFGHLALATISLVLPPVAPQPPTVMAVQSPVMEQPGDEESVIVVTAAGQTYPARGRELKAAQKAFRKFQPKYALKADLILQLSSATLSKESLRDISLRLVSDNDRIKLTLDEDLRFILPELQNDDWKIVSRRRDLRLAITPWVLSPGSEIGNWRLGDLLLQCRVASAVMRVSLNPIQSAMFGVAGGCGSKRTAVWQGVPHAIVGGRVQDGQRLYPLDTSAGSFKLPTDLEDVSYEARATLQFR